MYQKKGIGLCCFTCLYFGLKAQPAQDSTSNNKWSHHFHLTVIAQKHSGFHAAYSGDKSLSDTVEPFAMSLTSTLYLSRKLWKGAALYVNPELSGGRGLSYATGVAGALNGETYRVGATEPQAFIARAYLEQIIPLGKTKYIYQEEDVNQVAEKLPASRLVFRAGKFAISDFYDDNRYSKDPRSQFLNWSVWANGAWDYPANTRGYTMGAVMEMIQPGLEIRFSSVAVPRIANGAGMEYSFTKAHSETFEITHSLQINRHPGTVRLLLTHTASRAPSYAQGRQALAEKDSTLLDVIQGNTENTSFGGRKTGVGLNIEQEISTSIGFFSRLGWNDGKHVSWAFTEIDRTVSMGITMNGTNWNRPNDVWGIAVVTNAISASHRDFLKNGGYGFIIGDGRLNYRQESILEIFYNARLSKNMWLSLDYQFVNNPGYNKDRGPVHVFGIREHIEF